MPTVRIPTQLRKLTQGKEELTASGATIAELLDNLETEYAGLKNSICDQTGAVKRHVNVYKNDEDIRSLHDLETPLSADDEVSIIPAIAGG